MNAMDLVSFCYDFCLVPNLVPRHEVKRAYQAAILVERQEVSLASSLTSDLPAGSTNWMGAPNLKRKEETRKERRT